MNETRTSEPVAQLVRRCLHGDAAAWQLLVDRYARLVHAVAASHRLAEAEVEDVAQDAFVALAQHLHEIEDPERLSAWLVTTTRRLSWRAVQRVRRESAEDLEAMADGAAPGAAPLRALALPSLETLLHEWARQEALREGMDRLGERCRRLLALLFLDSAEPSYDEISAQLDLPKGSIGPTRNRCLQQLRSLLEGFGWRAP